MKKILAVIAALSILLLAGCGPKSPPIKPKPEHIPKVNQQITVDPQRAELVKATVRQVKGIDDVTTMVVDRDVCAAIKVSGFNRLRIKSIRDQAAKRIKENNPGFKVYLTSDKKLFSQLQQLEKENQESPSALKAKLNKIIGDM